MNFSHSPYILALSFKNLDDSVDSSNYFNHMHDLAVLEGGTFFAWDLSLQNSKDSYLCF